MKKILFMGILLLPAIYMAAEPRFPFPKNPDQVWQNDLDLISMFKKMGVSFATIDLSASTATINNTLQSRGNFILTTPPVTGNTAVENTTGGLADNTYYYKIFPFTAQGLSGFPSPEMRVDVGGAESGVDISWNAVPGASFYRVQRASASGSGDGYWQVTTTTYSDSGVAFTGNSVFGAGASNNLGYISGAITFPASIGAINWVDYTSNTVSGSINHTSAGEMSLWSTGGGNNANHFIFLGDGEQEILTLNVDYPDQTPGLTWQNGSGTLINSYWESAQAKFVYGSGRNTILKNDGISFQNDSGSTITGYVEASTVTLVTSAGNETHRADGTISLIGKTLAQIDAIATAPAGTYAYCSNCVTDALCVSTGAAPTSFVRVSARGTRCQ